MQPRKECERLIPCTDKLHTRAHPSIHAQTHVHTHTHTQALTLAHTHTHTDTHTHTHTSAPKRHGRWGGSFTARKEWAGLIYTREKFTTFGTEPGQDLQTFSPACHKDIIASSTLISLAWGQEAVGSAHHQVVIQAIQKCSGHSRRMPQAEARLKSTIQFKPHLRVFGMHSG